MKFKLAEKKLNYKIRNAIIKQYQNKTITYGDNSDIIYFIELPLTVAEKLSKMGFIDPMDSQDNSPTNEEMMEFVKKHPNFWFHGYLVTEKRDDTRISFEGIGCGDNYSDKDFKDFIEMFRHADEFVVERDKLWAWYD
jgi:hypothetical protein